MPIAAGGGGAGSLWGVMREERVGSRIATVARTRRIEKISLAQEHNCTTTQLSFTNYKQIITHSACLPHLQVEQVSLPYRT